MKALTKTLLSFSLICYLAVSSIAAVHAFPMPSNHQMDMSDSSAATEQVSMPCHQMSDDTSPQKLESNKNSVSTCDIFCAAMGHAMSHDFANNVSPVSSVSTEIVFIQPNFHQGDHSLEPHPPK